jgi:sec-independent protein translocase protein TatA
MGYARMELGQARDVSQWRKGISMYGIGLPELIIVLVLAFLVFGAGKLPEIGRGLGKAIKEFKAASKELTGGGSSALEDKSATKPEEVSKKS